jgi:predicted dehydrogenase
MLLTSADRFDLAIIAVPPGEQLRCMELLSRTANLVVCEKPCGVNFGELNAWLKAASSATIGKVLINYQLRYVLPSTLEALLSHIRKSAQLSVVYKSSARSRTFDPTDWRARSTLGGGVLVSVLSHLIDLLFFLGAEDITFHQVDLTTINAKAPDAAADVADVRGDLILGGRRHFRLQVNTTSPFEVFAFDFGGTRSIDLLAVETPAAAGVKGRLSSDLPGPWRNSYVRFAECILARGTNGAVPWKISAKPADALRVHAAIESMARMAVTQERFRTP